MSGTARRLIAGWFVMGTVAVGLLAFGSLSSRSDSRSNGERIDSLAREIRCQACPGESVFESRVPFADNVKAEIARLVASGKSDDEVKGKLVNDFGNDILLLPRAEGATVSLWLVPVIVLICGGVGLGLAFRTWRQQGSMVPTEEDRALVAEALSAPSTDDDL